VLPPKDEFAETFDWNAPPTKVARSHSYRNRWFYGTLGYIAGSLAVQMICIKVDDVVTVDLGVGIFGFLFSQANYRVNLGDESS